MGPQVYPRLSRPLSNFFSLTACLLSAAGCHNTCISGTLNSASGSTINIKVGNPPPSCTLGTANGIVHLEIGAVSGAASAPATVAPHATHLFVTLAGVDVHSSALAGDDSPGWEPLAPQLQAHPLQLDLLADPHASGSAASFPGAVLPAGIYRQIRLRVAASLPHQPGPGEPRDEPRDEPVLEANRCAGALHCAVLSDGRVQPLTVSPSTLSFRIPAASPPLVGENQTETFSGHELYIPPDGSIKLSIEFDRDHSLLWPSGGSFLFNPVFHLAVRPHPALPDSWRLADTFDPF